MQDYMQFAQCQYISVLGTKSSESTLTPDYNFEYVGRSAA